MTWERFVFALAGFLAWQAWRDLRSRIQALELARGEDQKARADEKAILAEMKSDLRHLLEQVAELKADFKACSDCNSSQ